MKGTFQAVRVSDRIYWVGAVDWELRDFHGYRTPRGSTYNAYLVTGSEPVLIDTVKSAFLPEMLSRIASVMDPKEIRHIISNHSEMDHTGSLPQTLQIVQPDRLYASANGAKALAAHFHWDQDVQVVKDGDRIELGDASFRFVDTRMLHWPDSMFTFVESDGVLFSNDGFGMHLASMERFDDEVDEAILEQEGAKYYANILMPFSPLVRKLLDRFPSLGLDVSVIAPDHGPIWRKNPGRIMEWYRRWSTQAPTDRAVVLFSTMWGSTRKMALAIADGLAAGGVSPRVMSLGTSHRSDLATSVLDAGALVVGAPTMNNNVFPVMADAMTYLKGLKPQNLVGAVFGSYGWSGESITYLEQMLSDMKVDRVADSVRVQYVPDGDALEHCRQLGLTVAGAMKEKMTM
ncbi:MAG: flavodoxin domain-containing protein [Deltaproteobacteria bacterium]|nr:flavodoxin domain-containing protein [Deltaproteobacteria bacterium]